MGGCRLCRHTPGVGPIGEILETPSTGEGGVEDSLDQYMRFLKSNDLVLFSPMEADQENINFLDLEIRVENNRLIKSTNFQKKLIGIHTYPWSS